MKQAKIIGIVALIVVGLILVGQNLETVNTQVLFWNLPMPRAVLLFITGLIGFVIGILASMRMRRDDKSK